jgi:hypothetical protein
MLIGRGNIGFPHLTKAAEKQLHLFSHTYATPVVDSWGKATSPALTSCDQKFDAWALFYQRS